VTQTMIVTTLTRAWTACVRTLAMWLTLAHPPQYASRSSTGPIVSALLAQPVTLL
jgi:hypothetical protein